MRMLVLTLLLCANAIGAVELAVEPSGRVEADAPPCDADCVNAVRLLWAANDTEALGRILASAVPPGHTTLHGVPPPGDRNVHSHRRAVPAHPFP